MDIEQLNKSQLVLLTLFVSFMTSIATGVVTVALMQEAPLAITETVNRVVERTVERVVPGQAAAAAAPITETVVVKESDQIARAVEKITPSVVRIYSSDATSSVFLGLGIVLDKNGTIAFDESSLGEATIAYVEAPGTSRVKASLISHNDATGLVYVVAATSTKEGVSIAWKPATLADGHATLGQSVVAISGKSAVRIGQGIITAVSPSADGVKDAVQILETNVSKDAILYGSPIMDIGGNILGLSTHVSRASSEAGFIVGASIPMPKKEAADSGSTTH